MTIYLHKWFGLNSRYLIAIQKLLWGILCLSLNVQGQSLPKLEVSNDHRYLVQKNKDGSEKPFFFLADTGWELLSRADNAEVEKYFQVRKEQGFNVIMMVSHNILGFKNEGAMGFDYPNREGLKPFKQGKAFSADGIIDGYWTHVDWVISKAEEYGLYIAFLPYFGNIYVQKEWMHVIDNNTMAYDWGYFLGNRYKNKSNIIWVLGGDFAPQDYYTKQFDQEEYQITIATAEGIADGINNAKKQFDDGNADYSTSLMTYHISERHSSSEYFHDAQFLDFNSIQSGHNEEEVTSNYKRVIKDYQKLPTKPVIDLESWYEYIMTRKKGKWEEPRCTDFDIRRNAYRSILSGAMGFSYGNNNVWMFFRKGMNIDPKYMPTNDWDSNEGIYSKGAEQIIWLKKLFETWPYYLCVPDSEIIRILPKSDTEESHIQAASARDNSFSVVYIPTKQVFGVDLTKIPGEIKCWWYNPENGQMCDQKGNPLGGNEPYMKIETKEKTNDFQFASPTNHDWVLIISNESEGINSKENGNLY